MRVAILAFAFAACVVPAQQQPTYYQQPGGQQAPAPAVAAAPQASCQDTLQCYTQCNPVTDACVGACDQRTTPDSQQNAHAVLQCMMTSGCQDQNCLAQTCGAQITTCTNLTVATTNTAPSEPASSGGCEAVMQPQKSEYGSVIIPPIACTITQSDLVGDWDEGKGTGASYYDSSGNYAGSTTISTATHWTIEASGHFDEKWKGATTSSGGAMAHGMSEDSSGNLTVHGNNTFTFDLQPNAYHQAPYQQHYIVVGWLAGPDDITMELQGPFKDPITQKDFDDVQGQKLYDKFFHRKR